HARELAGAGAKVVGGDLGEARGRAVADEVAGRYAAADVTDEAQVRAAVEAAEELGPLRVLVSCAGIGSAMRTLGRDTTYESAHRLDVFRRVLEVNLVGTFNALRLAATAMARTEPMADGLRGVVVNTASIAAYDGQVWQ